MVLDETYAAQWLLLKWCDIESSDKLSASKVLTVRTTWANTPFQLNTGIAY